METNSKKGGTAVATAPSKDSKANPSTALKVVESPKAGTLTADKPKEETPTPTTPTIESVREKSLKLNALFDKQEKLLETKRNLQQFRVASNEHTNLLTIEDGISSDFRTHNPVVIGSIIELLKKDIEDKLNTTQAEIISLA